MAISVFKTPVDNNILSGSAVTLVNSVNQVRSFGVTGDYVEFNIYDLNNRFLYQQSPFNGYKIPGDYPTTEGEILYQELEFDPSQDIQNVGFSYGNYILEYNILRPKIINTSDKIFFIKEISADRTEIRISTNNVSNTALTDGTLAFINENQDLGYFKEFYINFGQGNLQPAINIALDQNTTPSSVLVKLLNPLPLNIVVNALASVSEKISNTQQFQVVSIPDPVTITYPSLRGPNFDIELDNTRVNPTEYYNLSGLTTSKSSVNSNLQSLLGLISSSQFQINVDYTDYSNFIHYSSAQQRLDGFKYKLKQIEDYTAASASAATGGNTTTQLDAQNYQYKIDGVIQGLDGYEKFLYYESSSYAWPKTTSTKPYINASTSSVAAFNFYTNQSIISSDYDNRNQDYLIYALPTYVNENSSNQELFRFIGSIGTMFDEVWLYTKAITDLYKSKNALDQGISKDLVYYALQSMGINVYTDEDGTDVFQYLYGVNPDGTYLPNTGSYQTVVTASQYQIPGQDQQKGIYKRLYSNLPLLLKSKGTTRFIQYLNTIFGIPPTIMSYLEYGGVDKVESTSEYEYDRFTYTLQLSGSSAVSIPWNYTSQSLSRTGYSDIAPNGIEFRFKASPSYSATQSLFHNGSNYNLHLLYTNTGSANSIYSGSIGKFGYLQFNLGSTSVTTPTVPVFMTGSTGENSWYSVLVQRTNPDLRIGDVSTSQTYNVYIKNNVWGEVGHVASASLTTTTQNSSWYTSGTTLTFGSGSYPFSGSIQEARLWSNFLSESAFNSHVLNPESYEGNYTSSAYNDLAARFTLGNNLYTYNHSVTTTVASTAPNQVIQSFTASFSNFANKNNYTSFVETYYADVANSGYANPVTDKVRIVSSSLYGTQLLPNKSIELQPILPTSKDIHLLDAGLSPQDEINKDIIAQLGSTYTIDEFIGDPTGKGYDELADLRTEYFRKYVNEFNYKDFINLIEYFHNSLFRTLKDFTPARTNVATGIIIKPHLLERPSVDIPAPQVARHNNQSGSIDTLFITASNGGGYSQSLYNITYNTNLGLTTIISDARDFFTGELPSSSIFIHDDFDIANFNPFAVGFESDNTSSYSESIWNVNYNPLLNNVELNQTSSKRKSLTILENLTNVTQSLQYQDFTDSYQRHIRPRYEGSTTTSTLYNVFSNGDTTFGKTAAIDKNTRQFAFFSEIVASGSDLLSMPERSNVYIKYLIDETGSLTELTKRNYELLTEDQKYNLYQVQSIFKTEDTINIGLFDNQNPTKQQLLDGNKHIFAGGFKFSPVIWRRNDSAALTYNLVKPKLISVTQQSGGSTTPPYLLGDFNYTLNVLTDGNTDYKLFQVTVTYVGASPLVDNINVGVFIQYSYGGNLSNFAGFLIPINGQEGQTQNSTIYDIEKIGFVGIITSNIGPLSYQLGGGTGTGGTSTYNTFISSSLEATDQGHFRVHVSQSNVLIAPKVMSEFYYGVISGSYTSDGFYFNGIDSSSPTYGEADYPFILNPGDLIRLYNTGSSAQGFSILEEYEITSIHTPTSTNDSMSFSLNKNIDLGTIQSFSANSLTGSIKRYIISRKIPDETNIVIDYQKRDGQTSAGVVKNTNLAPDIDAKMANIVSDLKSKIFSTVLIP
jgi:hypothetical protein